MKERQPVQQDMLQRRPLRERAARWGAVSTLAVGSLGAAAGSAAAVESLSSAYRPAGIVLEDSGDQQSPHRSYPTREQVEAARDEYNDRQAKVVSLLALSALTAGGIGAVVIRRQEKRNQLEGEIPLSDQRVSNQVIANTLLANPRTREELRNYLREGDKSMPPVHEFTTTNPDRFVAVAKEAGAHGYENLLSPYNDDYIVRERPDGSVCALTITSKKGKYRKPYLALGIGYRRAVK